MLKFLIEIDMQYYDLFKSSLLKENKKKKRKFSGW